MNVLDLTELEKLVAMAEGESSVPSCESGDISPENTSLASIRTHVEMSDVKMKENGGISIPVLRLAEYRGTRYSNSEDGAFRITQKCFDEIQRNFSDDVIGRKVILDVDHNHKCHGIVENVYQVADHLFCDITLNENGRKERSYYMYASPEFAQNYTNKRTGKPVGAALKFVSWTNNPFQVDLQPIAMTDEDGHEAIMLPEIKMEENMNEETKNVETPESVEMNDAQGIDNGIDELRLLADAQHKTIVHLQEEIAGLKTARREFEVNSKIRDWKRDGKPAKICDLVGAMLMSESKSNTVKLSDDQSVSLSDALELLMSEIPSENTEAELSQNELMKMSDPNAEKKDYSLAALDQFMKDNKLSDYVEALKAFYPDPE